MEFLQSVKHVLAAAALFGGIAVMGQAVSAQEPASSSGTEQSPREGQLREQLKSILQELEELQRGREQTSPPAEKPKTVTEKVTTEEAEATGAMPEYELADTSIVSKRFQKRPEGVSVSSTVPSETDSQPTRTMKESMESLPGVVLRQANGPRDFSIMIRGQGAKTTFAVRDIKIYEDGFIQTQSDGLSRLDLHDPWFMRSVEVTRGASSSLYDNYALGGMVHFRTRRGSDINGLESFFSGGSFGYHKQAFAFGKDTEHLDVSMFVSNVGEDGYIQNSEYKTQTLNFNLRFKLDDKQSFYVKAISNWLDTKVPTRLTQAQFLADERQAGNNAVRFNQSRVDRRTILGGIYERQIDANTVLTVEADYDVKDIQQTFAQIGENTNPNYKTYTDLRHDGRLGAMPLRSYVGFFLNQMDQKANSFQNLGNFVGTKGRLIQNSRGSIFNVGGRFREELEFFPNWILAAGLGYEHSHLSAHATNYSQTTGAVASNVSASRTYSNWAPEMSLTWKPVEGYRYWMRGSTGYGIPTFGNLLRDPVTGQPGTNFDLKPQKNVNVELGTDMQLHPTLNFHLVGFWTFYRDEIITQTINAAQNLSASVNADSSEYRGVETLIDWRPVTGLRLSGAYTHIDARYINFSDRTNGFINRDGNKVANVPTDVFNGKIAYDHEPTGWGAWFEGSYYNSYFLNNSNTFGIPSYMIANINVHKTFEFKESSWIRFAKLYVEVDNIADRKYAASGTVIGGENHALAAGQSVFFAGYGRAIYGGVTLGMF
ncbi:MAG: TonB-dependent receptor [Nitrospira sp. ST-bin4]|nr:MAG: TonB-dependent receptor [Nitrospira sp. ST-bin4]